MTQDPLLAVAGLTRRFGGLAAVDAVSFSVARGAIHGLIGPNGAGKTTLFNLVGGLDSPSGGTIRLEGLALEALAPWERARRGLARTFQNLRVFPEMTALETVASGTHAHLRESWGPLLLRAPAFRRAEREAISCARGLLARVGLSGAEDRRCGDLAYGDQRRVEIARALAGAPKLLLLDEPAAGMNPSETLALRALLESLRAEGLTILLVEHDMGFVMSLCDAVTVLNFGRVIADGAPHVVRAEPQVIEAYLGPEAAWDLAGAP